MKCEEFQHVLAEAPDDALSPQDPELSAHLASCPACSRLQAELADTWKLLDGWSDVEPSADFKARFWQRVEARESVGLWGRLGIAWEGAIVLRRSAAVAVLVVLVAAGAFLVMQRSALDPLPVGGAVPPAVVSNVGVDDEQLLRSVAQIPGRTAADSLEVFDVWSAGAEETVSPAPSSIDVPKTRKPAAKPRGVSDENIG